MKQVGHPLGLDAMYMSWEIVKLLNELNLFMNMMSHLSDAMLLLLLPNQVKAQFVFFMIKIIGYTFGEHVYIWKFEMSMYICMLGERARMRLV